MANHTAFLRSSELFRTLTEEQVSRFAPLCSRFAAVEDALIFKEGREASHLYVVSEGQIALQKALRGRHGKRARRTIVAVCRPGEILGWSALVEPSKYTLSALAWESSVLIRIESQMLRRVLERSPEIGAAVMGSLAVVMSRRLRQITDMLINEREVSLAGLKELRQESDELGRLVVRPLDPAYDIGPTSLG